MTNIILISNFRIDEVNVKHGLKIKKPTKLPAFSAPLLGLEPRTL